MKIVKLSAENIKRLKAVEITPDGDMVVIAGKNGAGKSSVIDSIAFALEGGKKGVLSETPRPIRDGEDHASVKLDLGDLIVTRTWTRKKDGEVSTSLVVSNADGATYNSPQSMLDKLIGRLSFDPLGFTQMDDRTQLATLIDLVDLPFDPDELTAQRKTLYDNRTEVGREIKTLEGQLVGIPAEDVSLEPVNVADLTQRLATASTAKASFDRLMAEVGDLTSRLAAASGALEELGSFDNPADIAEEMAGAEETNRRYEAVQTHHRVAQQLKGAKDNSEAITTQITTLDKTKADALAAAEMPVKGLGFDEEGVTYNGIPFAQCSSAERLRVSMGMAMAANPEIRVIRIIDGSLLDSANMALISEMCSEHDFQAFVEVVDESGELGIVIEDGAIKGEA